MIYVGDNFFDDPYKVRSIALKQKYITEGFNYPGVRSFSVPEWIGECTLSLVKDLTKDISLKLLSLSFQSVTKKFGDGIFHRDPHQYICIVYLSLDVPANSGTEVCGPDHPHGKFHPPEGFSRAFHADPSHLITRYKYARLRKKVNSHYTPTVISANKFNRCVIFPATNMHRAQNFFGTSLEDSRLTLVSFIGSTEKYDPSAQKYYHDLKLLQTEYQNEDITIT